MVLADSVGTHEREAAPRENVKTEVTTTLGPFVRLLRKNGPDEAGDRGPSEVDATAGVEPAPLPGMNWSPGPPGSPR